MKTHLFTFRFISPFILFSAIIFTSIFFIYKYQYFKIFKEEQKIILDHIKYNIEIKINTIKSDLSVITAGIKDNYTEEEIKEYLSRIIKLNDSFINIYYCNLIPIKLGGMFINVPKPVPENFDQTTREWFNSAINTNGVYISDPYIDIVTKKLAVAFAKASYDEKNQLKGALGIDFSNMENIFMYDIKNSNYNLNIATKDGCYIVHNNSNYVLNEKYNLFDSEILKTLDKNKIDYSGNILISNKNWLYLNEISNANWILAAYGNLNILKNKFYKFLLPILIIIILSLIIEILLFKYVIMPLFYTANKLISYYNKIY